MEKNNTKAIKINDLELVDNIGILFENEVVLYDAYDIGAYESETCQMLKRAGITVSLYESRTCGNEIYQTLKNAEIPVSCFCDSNNDRWGQYIDGIEIVSPNKLKQLDNEKDILIIVTSNDVTVMDRIIADIAALDLKTNKIYTKFSLIISLLQNINDCRISKNYRNAISCINELHTLYHEQFLKSKRIVNTVSLIKNINKNDNILIYQSGKVGSLTVYKSITEIGIACTQVHSFTQDNEISDICQNIFKNFKTIKIITLVREPVSRGISLFFELLTYFGEPIIILPGSSYLNTIIDRLRGNSPGILPLIDEFDWFDNELKTVFGVDIYAHPFDREKGYSIIKQGNVEVLAMKMEKLNSLESVIGEFIGVPQFKLVNANEGDNKVYKYLYKNVKDTIKIPSDVFSAYYENNPKMDHFYSEEEKAAFLKKWEKNIQTNCFSL